ncbi:four helix bundle protein [candidate division WOR-3 bacterium]|nr:four helix bundle protein [candidate division WOR-3 bacterium]
MKIYRDLKVWQKAYEVALEVIKSADVILHPSLSERIILKQIIRSSTSICANIAEGYGSDSNPEFARYLGIAYKSALETDNWIQILRGCKRGGDKLDEIEQSNLESIKMLISLRKREKLSIKKNRY